MISPRHVPAIVDLLVSPHEHGSAGTRQVLAGLLDSLGLELKHRGLGAAASYCWGRADGLRRRSRSRRERPRMVN